MKIYVITKGEYSSYHIVGATTDEKLARKLQKIHNNKFCEARVETYEDSYEEMLPIYEVFANLDGKILEVNRQDVPLYHLKKEIGLLQKTPSGYILDVQAENEKIAKKIFFDTLAQEKAKKEGII